MTPFDSTDVTEIIVPDAGAFIVLRSSDDAEEGADYREVGRYSTRRKAEAALKQGLTAP